MRECRLYRKFLSGRATPERDQAAVTREEPEVRAGRGLQNLRLLLDAVSVFLNDGVCEDFAGDALDLSAGGVGA